MLTCSCFLDLPVKIRKAKSATTSHALQAFTMCKHSQTTNLMFARLRKGLKISKKLVNCENIKAFSSPSSCIIRFNTSSILIILVDAFSSAYDLNTSLHLTQYLESLSSEELWRGWKASWHRPQVFACKPTPAIAPMRSSRSSSDTLDCALLFPELIAFVSLSSLSSPLLAMRRQENSTFSYLWLTQPVTYASWQEQIPTKIRMIANLSKTQE